MREEMGLELSFEEQMRQAQMMAQVSQSAEDEKSKDDPKKSKDDTKKGKNESKEESKDAE